MKALTTIRCSIAREGLLGDSTCEVWLAPDDLGEIVKLFEEINKKNKPQT